MKSLWVNQFVGTKYKGDLLGLQLPAKGVHSLLVYTVVKEVATALVLRIITPADMDTDNYFIALPQVREEVIDCPHN